MKVTYAKAIGDALKEEMRRDSKILLFGEDVAEFGNIFGISISAVQHRKLKLKKELFGESNPDITLEKILTDK